MASPETAIVVRLDDSKIAGQLAGLQRSFATSFTEISSAINIAKTAIDLVAGTMGKLITAGLAVEQAETKAAAAMRRYGVDATATVESLKRYNSALQDKLGLDGDALLSMQAMLASIGVAPDRLGAATQAAIGLSHAIGVDLDTAARTVAKVLGGNSDALRRLGIDATSANDAFAKMMDMYQDSLGTTDSASVRQKALAEAFGDVAEGLGMAIVKTDTYRWAVEKLTAAAKALQSSGGALRVGDANGNFRDYQPGVDDPRLVRRPSRPLGFGDTDSTTPKAIGDIYDQETGKQYLDLITAQRDRVAKSQDAAAKKRAAQEKKTSEEYLRIISDRRAAVEEAEEQHNAAMRALQKQRELDELSHQTTAANITNEGLTARKEITEQFTNDMTALGITAAASFVQSMAVGIAQGDDAGDVLIEFLSGLLRTVGQMLIALGTAVTIAATASTPTPYVWPITGGPMGVGAGLAIAAAGVALTTGGALLGVAGGGSGGGGAARPNPVASGYMANRNESDRYLGRDQRGQAGSPTTIINVEFNRPVGDPRRAARDVADILAAADKRTRLRFS